MMKHRLGLPVGRVPRTLAEQIPPLKALRPAEAIPGERPFR